MRLTASYVDRFSSYTLVGGCVHDRKRVKIATRRAADGSFRVRLPVRLQ